MIRLHPSKLPVGNHKIIPATLAVCFVHLALQMDEADFVLEKEIHNNYTTYTYIVTYANSHRELKIFFATAFLFEIKGLEENNKDINATSKKRLPPFRNPCKQITGPQNKNEYRPLRKQIGLPEDFKCN